MQVNKNINVTWSIALSGVCIWLEFLTHPKVTTGFSGPTRLTRDPLWQRINSICGATTPGGGPWQHHLRSLGSLVLRSGLHVALFGWQPGRLIFKQFHSFLLTCKKQYEQEDNHVGEWMHILRSSLISGSLVGIGTLIDQLWLSPDCKSEEKEKMASGREEGRCRRANPSARLQRRRRRQLIVSGRLSLISCTIRATHPSAAHYNWARLGGAQLGHYTGH